MEKGLYRRICSPGKGGFKCPCCRPIRGKPTAKWKRKARKTEGRFFSKLIEDELRESAIGRRLNARVR